MTNKVNQDPLLTRKEAADYIGRAANTLSKWAYNKRYNLKYLKLGRDVRYQKSELDRYLRDSLVTPWGN